MPKIAKKKYEIQTAWTDKLTRSKRVRSAWRELFNIDIAREYLDGKQNPGEAAADWITINNVYSYLKAELPALYSTDPYFYVSLKRSFLPDPRMIDMWEKSIGSGKQLIFPLHVINDLPDEWNDDVRIFIRNEKEVISEKSVSFELLPYGKEIREISIDMPINIGAYQIIAEIQANSDTVRSIRDIRVE